MFLLAVIWSIISIYIIFRMIYQIHKRIHNWGNIVLNIQTPAIGMLIFPKYLKVTKEIQEIFMYVGIVSLGLSLIIIMKQNGLFKIKNGE